MRRGFIYQAIFAAYLLLVTPQASAATSLPLDPSMIPDLSKYLDQGIINALVKTVGLAANHRAYEPATPLGTHLGVDFGLEITLMKIPKDFGESLAKVGIPGTPQINLAVLPVPLFHVNKGLGPNIDIGASYIAYQNYKIYGGDAKLVFANPEEGVTWAARFSYSKGEMGIIDTKTYTPELLISKQLDFADPYMGIGYEKITGIFHADLPPLPFIGVIHLEKSGSAAAAFAFLGLQLHIPEIGFQITIEGTYNNAGADTLGTKVGFAF